MKKILLFLLLAGVYLFSNGQNAEKKWGLAVYGGKNEYNGDYGNGFLDFENNNIFGFAGGSLNRYLNCSFDAIIQGTYGLYGYYKDAQKNFKGKKSDINLLLVYKLNNGYLLKKESFFAPFVGGGIGMANNWRYNGSKINSGYDVLYTVAGGLKLNIYKDFALQYQMLYNFTDNDERDFWVAKNNDNYIAHSIGFVFAFGAPRDTDKDGVPDKSDKCPETPSGVKVDINGCPVDTDNDGVPDYLDKCPKTPRGVIVDSNGCPVDTDGDGIPDYMDKCPGTPAGVKVDNFGCPVDTDGDGVADYLDKCSDTPKGVKVDEKGCPVDSDGDGVPDYLDNCPNTPKDAKVDSKGCPIDTDGDGVPDYMDKCPEVKGIKENAGCPEVKAEVKKVFNQALQGIQFETGKDIIKKQSFPILDKVVKVMVENKEYNLDIYGHTDNTGKSNVNLWLSKKRAEAVKNYLIKKGIAPERLKSEGFGDTQPVESNKTEEGRAKNRRVEFKVVF